MLRWPTRKSILIWGPLVAYLALIFYLSGLSNLSWEPRYPDSLLHAVEYFGLAILVARALNGGLRHTPRRRILVFSFLFCVLFAISDEFHQWFVPNRYADIADVVADAAGAAFALLVLHLVHRMLPGGTVTGRS